VKEAIETITYVSRLLRIITPKEEERKKKKESFCHYIYRLQCVALETVAKFISR